MAVLLFRPRRVTRLFYDIGKSKYKERCAISETGTGFACAKLSEVRSSARVARVVKMTPKNRLFDSFRMTREASSLTVNRVRNAPPPGENLDSLGEKYATETFLITADQILLPTRTLGAVGGCRTFVYKVGRFPLLG